MGTREKSGTWRERLFAKCRTGLIPGTPVALGILGCIWVTVTALRVPIDLVSGQLLQWAESIGTVFKFQTTEIPHLVYPSALSNGGPNLYFGGLGYALTHSVDGAIAFGTASSFGMLVVGLMLVDPWLPCVAVAALLVWPMFTLLSTTFLAEFWATGLTLAGLAFFVRAQSAPTTSKLFTDRRTWLAFLLFSLALSSKVVACFAVCGVIFATVFARERPRNVMGAVRNGFRALATTAICCAIVGMLFFVEFGFEIVHTLRSVQGALTVPSLFQQLIVGMMSLAATGKGAEAHTFATQFHRYSNPQVLIVIIAAALILVLCKPSYSLLVLFAAVIWVHFGMDERETLPVFFIILALGLREAFALVDGAAQRYRLPPSVLRIIAIVCILVFTTYKVPLLAGAREADPQRRYGANLTAGYMHYSREMVQDLKAHAYVLIPGIIDLPQIDPSWGLTFYDRFMPTNAHLWDQDAVLLFDAKQPATTVAGNCASVIRADGDLVLCRARKDVPLAYVPDAVPPGRLRTIDLSKIPWNMVAGFQRTSDGPHGAPDYRFAGPGTLSSGEVMSHGAVTLVVPVQPGVTYVFSAWVDPSKLSAAGDQSFDLVIFDAAGPFIENHWWPVGPPGRYALPPWKCPQGIHRVILGLGLTGPTFSSDQALRFSEPALTEISAAPSPAPGK